MTIIFCFTALLLCFTVTTRLELVVYCEYLEHLPESRLKLQDLETREQTKRIGWDERTWNEFRYQSRAFYAEEVGVFGTCFLLIHPDHLPTNLCTTFIGKWQEFCVMWIKFETPCKLPACYDVSATATREWISGRNVLFCMNILSLILFFPRDVSQRSE